MIEENLSGIFADIKNGNAFGEKITLVGATKTVDVDTINLAIKSGLSVVAENKVKEFREKTDFIEGAEQQFIGHLQTNKVKYLVGKVSLIQSVDSIKLAEEIDAFAKKSGVVQSILAEINVGGEESKSGFSLEEAESSLKKLALFENLKVKGIMAMLPKSNEEATLKSLCTKTRALYDKMKKLGFNYTILSMGMTEDYKTAISCGSNMIRIGSGIFGKRNYEVQ